MYHLIKIFPCTCNFEKPNHSICHVEFSKCAVVSNALIQSKMHPNRTQNNKTYEHHHTENDLVVYVNSTDSDQPKRRQSDHSLYSGS